MNLAINPDGTGMSIKMANSTLEELGIADLDVTKGNFNLDAIDKAMSKVASQRSGIGASTNRLEYAYNYNTSASLEQLSSRSRLEDLDMPKAISEKKKEELLSQYKNLMLRRQMDQESLVTRLFHWESRVFAPVKMIYERKGYMKFMYPFNLRMTCAFRIRIIVCSDARQRPSQTL